MINNTPHAMIDKDLLEEDKVNANVVHIRFYGRPSTKHDTDKWETYNCSISLSFKIEKIGKYV